MCDIYQNNDVLPVFSEYRKEKLSKTKNILNFYQSATAERLLCYAAKNENLPLQLNIKTACKGKPLSDDLNFSISHSGEKVLLAVADGQIGADIQKINPLQNLNVAQKILTPDERKNIGVNRFFELFTKKESYFKMTGEGLWLSPVSFKDFKKCYFNTFKIDQYFVSVCTEKEQSFKIEYVPHESLADS